MSDSDSDFECPIGKREVRRSSRILRSRRSQNECQQPSRLLRSRMVVQGNAVAGTSAEDDEIEHESDSASESGAGNPFNVRIGQPGGENDESSCDSNGSGERCTICLSTLREQEVGIPNSCTHMYCGKCIEEWSKDVRTCPIDRLPFTHISFIDNIQTFTMSRQLSLLDDDNPEDSAQNEVQVEEVEETTQSDSENEIPLAQRIFRRRKVNTAILDEDSNESTSSGEKCTICYSTLKDQEIGIPNSCAHKYCSGCIEEWSQTVRTCPIDRLTFSKITIVENIRSARVIREISVADKSVVMAEPYEEEYADIDNDIHCQLCNDSGHEETLLLCDSCNDGYHMSCLDPPLTRVPEGHWLCYVCRSCTDIETLFQTRRRRRNRRSSAQTRRRTSNERSRRTCRIPIRSLLSNAENGTAGSANGVEDEFRLGGPSLWERHRAEVPSLSLFGLRNQLDYFVSEDDSDSEHHATRSSESVGLLVAPSRSRTSTVSSLQNRKGILHSILTPRDEPSSAAVDVLSNILNAQEMWHNLSRRNNTKNVRITPDGNLDFSEVLKSDKPSAETEKKRDPPPETQQAPMYPRGGRNSGGGGYYNNRQGGNRGGGNFRNNSNYSGNYQGNYQNSTYNQFNRGNQSNFGNYQGSNAGGGGGSGGRGRENFSNTFQPFQLFRNNNNNNNNNQNSRGRQQFPPRGRGQQMFTPSPNRFNQRNQNRDNFDDFSNNIVCSNRSMSDNGMNLSGMSEVNRIESDQRRNVLNLEVNAEGQGSVNSLTNVDSDEEVGSAIGECCEIISIISGLVRFTVIQLFESKRFIRFQIDSG